MERLHQGKRSTNEAQLLENLEIPEGSTVEFWTPKGYKVYINGVLLENEINLITIVNEGEEKGEA